MSAQVTLYCNQCDSPRHREQTTEKKTGIFLNLMNYVNVPCAQCGKRDWWIEVLDERKTIHGMQFPEGK